MGPAVQSAWYTLVQHGAAESAVASTQDPVSQALVGIIIVSVFVLLAMEKAHRVLVVFSAVALLWTITYLTPYRLISFEASARAIDLNVLLLLASMMAVVGVLKSTGVFTWAVSRLVVRAGGRPLAMQRLVFWFTAAVSAVADNVTTVIFVTPMAAVMARQAKIRLEVILLPMVIASNIGGTATLIGDPPNILIGSAAGLSFVAFLSNLTIPIILMMFVLEWYTRRFFRDDLAVPPSPPTPVEQVIHDPALLRWGLGISAFIFLGFLTHSLTGMPAAVPAVIGAALLLVVQDVLYLRRHRPSHDERTHGLLEVIEKEIEWPTLSFFAFLFIAVGAAMETGLIDTLANGLAAAIHQGGTVLGLGTNGVLILGALLILWVAAVVSALIDNIPFVAVTIPIVARLAGELHGDTVVLWWALSLGACLGGNGSPIGASANVTVLGLAEREGLRIAFKDFLRFAVPMTVLTILISSVFVIAHVAIGITATLQIGLALTGLITAIKWVRSRRAVGAMAAK